MKSSKSKNAIFLFSVHASLKKRDGPQWDDVLPAAELVGLPARDESLCEVGTGLVSRPREHKCIQGL